MKRFLVPVMAVAVVVVTACTRTVIERVPVRSSPVTVDVGAADPSLDPIVRVVQAVRPAVVNVTTNLFQPNPLGGESGRGVGTGFVIRSNGIAVTNFHVVEHAQRITVITPPPDSTRYTARVIGGGVMTVIRWACSTSKRVAFTRCRSATPAGSSWGSASSRWA